MKNLKLKEQEEKIEEAKNKTVLPDYEYEISIGDKTAYFKKPERKRIAYVASCDNLSKEDKYKLGVELLNELFVGGDKCVIDEENNIIPSFQLFTSIATEVPVIELEDMTEDEREKVNPRNKRKVEYKISIEGVSCFVSSITNEQKIKLMFSLDKGFDVIITEFVKVFTESFVPDLNCKESSNFLGIKGYELYPIAGAFFMQTMFDIKESIIKKKS